MTETELGSFEIGDWILFVICLLVLEIFQFKNSAVFKLLIIP